MKVTAKNLIKFLVQMPSKEAPLSDISQSSKHSRSSNIVLIVCVSPGSSSNFGLRSHSFLICLQNGADTSLVSSFRAWLLEAFIFIFKFKVLSLSLLCSLPRRLSLKNFLFISTHITHLIHSLSSWGLEKLLWTSGGGGCLSLLESSKVINIVTELRKDERTDVGLYLATLTIFILNFLSLSRFLTLSIQIEIIPRRFFLNCRLSFGFFSKQSSICSTFLLLTWWRVCFLD